MSRRGFTLVELLIVIIILAVIAAIAIPKFNNSSRMAKEAALKDRISLLRSAVEQFHSDTGLYPANLNTLLRDSHGDTALNSAGQAVMPAANSFCGPYLNSIPKDPISGGSFSYTTTAPNVGRVLSGTRGNFLDGSLYTDF